MRTQMRTPKVLAAGVTPACWPQDGLYYCDLCKVLCSVSGHPPLERSPSASLYHPVLGVYSLSLSPTAERWSASSCSKCMEVLDTSLFQLQDTWNWAMCFLATPSWNTGFCFKILEDKEYHFHIKININGQNATLDEFQRASLKLQKEFKFAFAVLDQVLSPPLGCSSTVLCLFIVILRVLGFNPVAKYFLPIQWRHLIQRLSEDLFLAWLLFPSSLHLTEKKEINYYPSL